MKPMPFVYFRGAVVPQEEAQVSLASHSLQYGSTCFTGMRGYVRNGCVRLFRLRDHYIRLRESLNILGWESELSYEQFSGALQELIEKNQPEGDFYIRPFFVTESEELRLDYTSLRFELAIYMVPFGALFDRNRGLSLKISSWRKIGDDQISTKAKAGGAYVNACLAATDARRDGYDDALMLNGQGQVVELSGANILVVYRGQVLTPPLGTDILDGITLRSMIEILESEGIRVEQMPIDRSMVYSSEEMIVLGTAAQVAFAASVDRRTIADGTIGPVCHLLRKRFDAILNRQDPRFDRWITEWELPKQIMEEICCCN